MITSDIQCKSARTQLEMLAESILSPKKENVPDAIEQAGKAQTRELINEIQQDINEYETLKNTRTQDVEIHSLDDLMIAPIRYRIAAHMSIDEFGRKVGVSARQIIRYENENYQNINASTLQKILKELNIHLEGKVEMHEVQRSENAC